MSNRAKRKTHRFHPARIVHEHRLYFSPLMESIGVNRVSQSFLKLVRRGRVAITRTDT